MIQKIENGYFRNGQAHHHHHHHFPVEQRAEQLPSSVVGGVSSGAAGVVIIGGNNERLATTSTGKQQQQQLMKSRGKSAAAARSLVNWFSILCVIFLIVVCCGFVGFSYHLYARQNVEVQLFTEKINQMYGEINRLSARLDNSLSYQNDVIDELRKKVANVSVWNEQTSKTFMDGNKQNNSNFMQDMQARFHMDPLRNAYSNMNMLQGSGSTRLFKSVAIENIEEYPDGDDLEEGNIINNDYQEDEPDNADDDTEDEKSAEEVYNNYHPVNISLYRTERNGSLEKYHASNNTNNSNENNNNNSSNSNSNNNNSNNYNNNNNNSDVSGSDDESLNVDENGRRSKISKRNAPLPLSGSNTYSRNQAVNNSKSSRFSNVNGLSDQNSPPDTLDLMNENKKSSTSTSSTIKGQGKSTDKRCMISIPLEDFINHFKNYQHEYNGKMQELLNKTIPNCSTTSGSTVPVNGIKQNSNNRRSKYNFRLRSSEEEDGDRASVESIMPHRKKVREDKSDRLVENKWKKQLDVEILSENANDDESLHMRPREVGPVAIHAGGHAVHYAIGQHCYEGNGRLCHPNGDTKDWKASNWFEEYQMHHHFTLTDGKLRVHKGGLYFVYSQILFSDGNDYNGYYIMHNAQIALQCTTNIPTMRNILHNSCYTGGIIRCNENDVLSIKIDGNNRYVKLLENMSYFGMFKVGEIN